MFNKNICKIMLMAAATFMLSCNSNPGISESANQDTAASAATAAATDSVTANTVNDTTTNTASSATVAAITDAFPDNEKSTVQILQTGKLNPGEVDKNVVNKKWIGLFKIASMYFLHSTRLKVFPTTDTNASVVRKVLMVNTSLLNRCVILISGLENINEKNLLTAQRSRDTVFPNEEVSVKLKNDFYKISAGGVMERNNDGTFQIHNYRLFLTANINGVEVKQLLVAQPVLKNEMVSILWTGDLDGDGKLDLVINASPAKGFSTPALYLSSRAAQKELVKFVGQHVAR